MKQTGNGENVQAKQGSWTNHVYSPLSDPNQLCDAVGQINKCGQFIDQIKQEETSLQIENENNRETRVG